MDSREAGEIIIYFVAKQTFMPFPKPCWTTKLSLVWFSKDMRNDSEEIYIWSEIYFKSSYNLQIDLYRPFYIFISCFTLNFYKAIQVEFIYILHKDIRGAFKF
jgi:hypothetical protein